MGNRSCREDWRPSIDRHWPARTSRPSGVYRTGVLCKVQVWQSWQDPCFLGDPADSFVDSVRPLSDGAFFFSKLVQFVFEKWPYTYIFILALYFLI